MALLISPNLTQRQYDWTTWKSIQAAKNLVTQHEDDGSRYTVFGYDGPEVILCTIYKGNVPTNVQDNGYTQEQNDADKADFEANYKPTSNASVESRTRDGRKEVRYTTVRRLQNFNLRVFSFYTARSGSLHNVNSVTGQPFYDIEYYMYDASGSLIADPTQSGSAVKTVVEFEPNYDYEIVGGFADLPADLKDGTTDEWYIGGVGVPDLPSSSYGSIPYVGEINIEAVQIARVVSDGRATSFMPHKLYGYPTNKIRFYVKHPAGAQRRFQFYLEHYT